MCVLDEKSKNVVRSFYTLDFHSDSKWASQFRQHGITAAALLTSKVKQSKVHLNLRNWLEFGAQRNGSSMAMRHWKKPKNIIVRGCLLWILNNIVKHSSSKAHMSAGAAHLLDHIVQVEGAAAVAAAAGPPPVAARPEAALLSSLSSQAWQKYLQAL